MNKARIAGAFYLLTFATGGYAAFVGGRFALAAMLVAAASYVVVTALFYVLFEPVNRTLSLIAASFSLAGCVNGGLSTLRLTPIHIDALVFFGFYCLLIGYLIFRSAFLPRTLGVLMAIGGLGWLTFVSRAFARSLYPYNMFLGMVGEGALTVWLLAFGVNVRRWEQSAHAA